MKRIVILVGTNTLHPYTSLKMMCNLNKSFSHSYLRQKKQSDYPFKYKGYTIHRLEVN